MTSDLMTRCLALFVLIGWTASASAQTEFRMVDGTTQVGRLVALTAEGVLTVETESSEALTLDARRVLWARRGIPEPVVHAESSPWLQFDLHGGDRIFARIADSDYDTVKLDHPRLGRLSVPLDGIREVTILANTAGAPAIFGSELPRDRDVVFIRSGAGIDHVIGEVLRFGQGSVQFEWNDEESTFDFARNRVLAVRLAEAERTVPPSTLESVVLLDDGSLLSGRLVKTVDGPLTLQLTSGVKLSIDLDAVRQIGFRNAGYAFLSDLEPSAIEEVPFIEGGLTFGLHRDEGLRGGPPSISGELFPKALCVHSRCQLRFDLDQKWESFSSAVGIDGAVAEREVKGAVSFSVLVDDVRVAGPTIVRAGEAPVWITGIDLRGKKTLTLLADFADNYHFNGWAVWGGALLVKPLR